MKPLTKILILALIIGAFGYLAFQVFGGTTFNKTLDRGNTDLANGLVGHWTFDGQNIEQNVADSSGQGYTGYLSGFSATTTVTGRIGQALDFDGTDDYVSVGTSYNGVKTVAFWVKGDSTSEKVIDLNGTESIEITNGYISANGFTSPTVYIDGTASSTIDTGWHHVVITTGTGINASALDIGRIASSYFGGMLDDVRIYNRILSEEEANRLYHLGATTKINKTIQSTGSPLEDGLVGHWTFDGQNIEQNVADSSGQGNTGALILGSSGNTSTTTVSGRIGQALEFDGTDDYVDMGASYNGVQTVAFWVKGDSTSEKVIDLNGTESIEITNGYISANGFTSPTVYIDGTASSTIDTGWHHVVITTDTGMNASAMTIGKSGSGGGIIVSDLFTGSGELSSHVPDTGTGWTEEVNDLSDSRTMNLVSGAVQVSASASGGHTFQSAQPNPTSADYDVESNMDLDAADGGDYPGYLVGRWQDDSNWYAVRMTFDSTEKIKLYKNVAGTKTLLGTSASTPSEFSKIKLELRGTAIKVYLDDTEEISVTDSAHSAAGKAGLGLRLGPSDGEARNSTKWLDFEVDEVATGGYLDGKLDDVRIYNRALSADEAKRLYHLGATTKINKTIQSTGSPLENGLVGHWTFDGQNIEQNATDSSGQGNNGYLSGFTSTTTTIGIIGQALEFDGNDDYIDIPETHTLKPTSAITMATWVKADTLSSFNTVFGYPRSDSSHTNPYWEYMLMINGSGNYAVRIDGEEHFSAGSTVSVGNWVYLTITWDGATNKITYYHNGVAFDTDTTVVSSITYNSDNSFYFGQNASGNEEFDGLIDDVRVYNRALSADEVLRLYKMGQ